MRKIIQKVYKFDELSEEVKEKVIQNYREGNLDYEWWNSYFDDFKEIGKLMGIKIDNIYFSGFYSQGDGACFEGSYDYNKGSVKAIKKYAPKDKELHQIAINLSKLQRPYFYKIGAVIKHSGHYSNEYCTDIELFSDNYIKGNYIEFNLTTETEDAFIEELRNFMRWIYKRLEKEYEFLQSDEQIIESIKINDYEFYEDGKMY